MGHSYSSNFTLSGIRKGIESPHSYLLRRPGWGLESGKELKGNRTLPGDSGGVNTGIRKGIERILTPRYYSRQKSLDWNPERNWKVKFLFYAKRLQLHWNPERNWKLDFFLRVLWQKKHLESGKELKDIIHRHENLALNAILESGKELKDLNVNTTPTAVAIRPGIRKGIESKSCRALKSRERIAGIRKGIESFLRILRDN